MDARAEGAARLAQVTQFEQSLPLFWSAANVSRGGTRGGFSRCDVVKTCQLALMRKCAILDATSRVMDRHMFLRRCERAKNGKTHTYWALVESIRTAKGSRQKVVAYLGELKPSEQSGRAQLGQRLPAPQKRQRFFFAPPHHDDPVAEEDQVLVRLKDIRLE